LDPRYESKQESRGERSSAIDRACGFFLENNDNYKISWQEANDRIALGHSEVPIFLMKGFRAHFYT
jgi:hypothetical protein